MFKLYIYVSILFFLSVCTHRLLGKNKFLLLRFLVKFFSRLNSVTQRLQSCLPGDPQDTFTEIIKQKLVS